MTRPENTPALEAERSESGAVSVSEKSYHGTPCRRCGATLRLKSNQSCTACNRRSSAVWREQNRERVREYEIANRERIAAQRRAWEEANPEARAAANARYKDANRERIRRLDRERYRNLDHIAYYTRQLQGRRYRALKRKEKRHGSLSDEG